MKAQRLQSTIAVALGLVAFIAMIAMHAATPSRAIAASDGKAVFDTNCSTCHGGNGQGQPGVFPPLAGNTEVTAKDPKPIIGIVLHGLNVPKTIMGKQYSGGMPSWSSLSNADIAAVLTYVRSAWGNKASAVTEAEVAAVRK